ncbi:MAG: hypothetical protein ABIR22_03470 [Candidatus Eisenbacteria bacterium]
MRESRDVHPGRQSTIEANDMFARPLNRHVADSSACDVQQIESGRYEDLGDFAKAEPL